MDAMSVELSELVAAPPPAVPAPAVEPTEETVEEIVAEVVATSYAVVARLTTSVAPAYA
jgi:hypothetical protein